MESCFCYHLALMRATGLSVRSRIGVANARASANTNTGRGKMDYIHNNPVEAGIVEEPQHYLFSSARDYCDNRKGLVDISYIE